MTWLEVLTMVESTHQDDPEFPAKDHHAKQPPQAEAATTTTTTRRAKTLCTLSQSKVTYQVACNR